MGTGVRTELRGANSQKTRVIFVIGVVISSLLFFLFQGGKLALMLFFIIAVLSLYLLFGKWSGIARVTGRRVIETPMQDTHLEAGTALVVRIEVKVPGYWPIPYMMIRDRVIRKNGGEHEFSAFLIPDWYRKGSLTYSTPPLYRGIYHFGRTECSTQDIFGIFEHKGVMELPAAFSVLPKTVAIREWNQLVRMHKGLHHHSSTTRANRETTQINGVREYNYGDRLSRIHWNATAKTGTMKSKEFERESFPKTVVILDRLQRNYRSKEEFELAVSVAASLIQYGRKKEFAFGLLSAGEHVYFHEANMEQTGINRMLHHLISAESDGQLPLLRAAEEYIRLIPSGTCVVIVSPKRDEDLQTTLAWLKNRQMIAGHIWLTSSKEEGQVWCRHLQVSGYLGYAVNTLDDLPEALGGIG